MEVSSITLTYLLVMLVRVAEGFNVNRLPTATIVVHVSKRRAKMWDPWEVNRRICPPSLCKSSDPSGKKNGYRPRGTAGTPFYQGDIILNNDEVRYVYEDSKRRSKRATMRIRNRLWKDGIIPYKMSEDISKASESIIKRAIKHIEARTCIRFRERKPEEKNYVRYISEPGCWSNVGKKGGAQLVSIGRGCENLGTTVHETTHALGVWHEQARPDRDKYIEVLKDNISPRFLPDFKILNKRLVTSRGYPYDYSSVMHYNKFAFTRAGQPTIKVIGIGKKLKMKIGQRQGLSTIDIAQLREMYHCNTKEDTKATLCPKGWVKFKTNCYKFYSKPKHQFSGAIRECEKIGGHLTNIQTKSEDKFLQKQILKKFPNVNTWRIGGKQINGTMMWFRGEKAKAKKMKYTNWAKNMPSTYTSVILKKDKNTKKFLWHGEWVGSHRQLPNFIHSFICERRAKRKCIVGGHKDGRDYRGKLDHTIEGITCQKWTEQYPHTHKLTPKTSGSKEDGDGLGDHNYCRNPSGKRRGRPWCYTTKAKKEWQYCDITICSKQKNKNNVKAREKANKRKNDKQKPRVQKPRRQKPRRNERPKVRRPTNRRENSRQKPVIESKQKIKPIPKESTNKNRNKVIDRRQQNTRPSGRRSNRRQPRN